MQSEGEHSNIRGFQGEFASHPCYKINNLCLSKEINEINEQKDTPRWGIITALGVPVEPEVQIT